MRIERRPWPASLRARSTTSGFTAWRQARRKFYGDSPAGIERDGYLADLPAVTPETLTAAYREMLSAAQIDVICLGTDEAAVRAALLEKLAGAERGPGGAARQPVFARPAGTAL